MSEMKGLVLEANVLQFFVNYSKKNFNFEQKMKGSKEVKNKIRELLDETDFPKDFFTSSALAAKLIKKIAPFGDWDFEHELFMTIFNLMEKEKKNDDRDDIRILEVNTIKREENGSARKSMMGKDKNGGGGEEVMGDDKNEDKRKRETAISSEDEKEAEEYSSPAKRLSQETETKVANNYSAQKGRIQPKRAKKGGKYKTYHIQASSSTKKETKITEDGLEEVNLEKKHVGQRETDFATAFTAVNEEINSKNFSSKAAKTLIGVELFIRNFNRSTENNGVWMIQNNRKKVYKIMHSKKHDKLKYDMLKSMALSLTTNLRKKAGELRHPRLTGEKKTKFILFKEKMVDICLYSHGLAQNRFGPHKTTCTNAGWKDCIKYCSGILLPTSSNKPEEEEDDDRDGEEEDNSGDGGEEEEDIVDDGGDWEEDDDVDDK